jgi:hypothetical protein
VRSKEGTRMLEERQTKRKSGYLYLWDKAIFTRILSLLQMVLEAEAVSREEEP